MTGRHASLRSTTPPSWPRRLALAVAAAAAVGAAGLGAASVLQPSDHDCVRPLPLTIAADPSIAPVLTEVADLYAETAPRVGDACVAIDVAATSSRSVAPTLGTAYAPDLWVPKSSLLTQGALDERVNELASVAISPLVVVMQRPAATHLGWPDAQLSWQAVLQGDQATVADPAANDEGMASLVAVRTALANELEQAELVQLMTEVSRSTTPTTEDAFSALTAGDVVTFTATEQAVIMHNRTFAEAPAVAVYPAEGTLAFDYPALAVQPSDDNEAVRSAVADFVIFLSSMDALDAIRTAGFRAPDGTAAELAGVVHGIQSAMPELLPDPDPGTVSDLARQWAALALDMRMLAVIDISGSMNEQVEGGGTRIELTRDAALEALRLFPATSSIGLWAFSTLQDPPRDHIELVDVGPLDEQLADGTRMDALVDALSSLPDRADGGTGLYDTALAAFQEIRGGYEAGKINSVVLLTDGRNEDDPDGIDLATLLNSLTALFDPAEPVPVITIGMGPDADMDALGQISTATGTTAYQAEDPLDIKSVFVQAMIERQCRPNC